MKSKMFAITTLLILSCCLEAFADTILTAQLDKLKITTDEAITYKLSIDSSENKIPRPQLPNFADFTVISQAQSSTVSWASGSLKTNLIFTYVLTPKSAGKLKIEPAKIKINGKYYVSQEFEVEVTQGKIAPQPKPEEHPLLPEDIQGDIEGAQITL